jgi:hypothetical protein
LIALSILALGITACATPTEVPKTWIDKPLDGSTLPLEPIFIMAHASDADGVADIEFHVNGQFINSAGPAEGAGARLGHVETVFNPPGFGTYRIEVHAVDSLGNAGFPAHVEVIIAEDVAIPEPESEPVEESSEEEPESAEESPAPPSPAEEPAQEEPPADEEPPEVDIILPDSIDTTPPGIFGAATDKDTICSSQTVTANIITGDEESPVQKVSANWVLKGLNGSQLESGYKEFSPIAGQPYGYTVVLGPFGNVGTLTINGTVENSLNPPLVAYFTLTVSISPC